MKHIHTYSEYTKEAVQFAGNLIRIGRKERRWSETNLAERAGISRSTLRSIENGSLGSSVGLVFELAALVGVPLFDVDAVQLSDHVRDSKRELMLLPARVRVDPDLAKDDF